MATLGSSDDALTLLPVGSDASSVVAADDAENVPDTGSDPLSNDEELCKQLPLPPPSRLPVPGLDDDDVSLTAGTGDVPDNDGGDEQQLQPKLAPLVHPVPRLGIPLHMQKHMQVAVDPVSSVTSTMSMRTSAVTILSSDHGRMRRAQRMVAKRDLQAAVKHGVCERSTNQRGKVNLKYTFADIVYITDLTSTKEVTSWAVPGAGLDVEKELVTSAMQKEHDDSCLKIETSPSSWTSHTVIVVDQSGSMRKTDVPGGATRSDAVWLTLAVDFVAKQLDARALSHSDVVSVVTMQSEGNVVINKKPVDWLLYNSIIDLLRTQEPKYDGNYTPSLDLAEELLVKNDNGSCACTLFFLSDGKPSDRIPRKTGTRPSGLGSRGVYHDQEQTSGMTTFFLGMVKTSMAKLSSRFGRRLTVTAVGFGGSAEEFGVLETLASQPGKFGSTGTFVAAGLSPDSLGCALNSLASSLSATKTELTVLDSSSPGQPHQQRVRNVVREARDTVDDTHLNESWLQYVRGRDVGIRQYWSVSGKAWKEIPFHSPSTTGVAMRRKYFGEGAERLVRKFRETNAKGQFVGPKLVAKESRFVTKEATDVQSTLRFHQTFCKTQSNAKKMAAVFNSRLALIPGVLPSTPRVNFLDCSVYHLSDSKLGDIGVLVEEQLDESKYKKWNDNCGGVNGVRPGVHGEADLGTLAALPEITEEDEGSDSDDDEIEAKVKPRIHIADNDIPQAFSHFTYRYTQRKLLVCDLQGVLTTAPSATFQFTDPVIHYRSSAGRKHVFGRTDRGKKGISAFFQTHECSDLCKMLNKRWVKRTAARNRGGAPFSSAAL